MEDRWLHFSKRLHAIASSGLFFSEDDFERERYQEISEIALEMLSDLSNQPIKQISALFPEFALGYATPKVDVRGAIVRDNKILLVRENLDGLWTLPGGYADVGLSAAENAVKEVKEEAALDVEPEHLLGVFHKSKHEYDEDIRDFYKFYFFCRETKDQEPGTGSETSDVGFFDPEDLPPLSKGRNIKKHIMLAFEYLEGRHPHTAFD